MHYLLFMYLGRFICLSVVFSCICVYQCGVINCSKPMHCVLSEFSGKSLKISHKQHFPVFSDSEFSYNLPQQKPELNLEMKVKLRIPPLICFILLQVFV